METNKIADKDIPYIVFESTICRFDRVIKRLWIVILILIFLLLGTNLAWLYYESQFEEVTEVTTTTQGVKQKGDKNTFIGGDNGYSENKDNNSKTSDKES